MDVRDGLHLGVKMEGFHRQVVADESNDYCIPHHNEGSLKRLQQMQSWIDLDIGTVTTGEEVITLILIPHRHRMCLKNFGSFIDLGEMD
ncbi:hypothetical protein VNO77_04380 [Canavalia gladiata]|uniref:Uncharacterized protein n=1 Tax=Canavalia gladiata TaxID=3824 RepID=A0AAN9R4R4_CANGL